MLKNNLQGLWKFRLPLLGILSIATALLLAFAWIGGLVGPGATTKEFLGDSLDNFPPGYRRAHGKGMCFSGIFNASGALVPLSTSRIFLPGRIPAVGRFSIGTVNPHAADNSTATVSMALMLVADDKSQWRMKLNNEPYFATRDAEGFLAQIAAFAPVATTGQPDPDKVAAFFDKYPEARKYVEREANATLPTSFAGAEYNSVNAFVLIAADGKRQHVRWSMRPHAAIEPLSKEAQAQASHDFLFDEIAQRVGIAPLYWDLVFQLAEEGDPVNDPSQPWPSSRKEVIAGTLEVTQVVEQTHGECRDINFDPTLVPPGIALSDDPVLAARAGIYSQSYNARLREIGFGKATDAIGKKEIK
ncbi:Catalase-related peroxidase [Pseudomonas sp. Bi70]|uniref:catalase family peroxidase n=1 Tax=Pseudomonas sp. Bi70 TaxID=2821127 RepID=UPI001D7F8593|nr:catalase family peroxidase [Pseudomonas sp. Bi70]CAH0144370.1 Catalase-related peroxidase [Pseudomonas sp. Bi70]